jgi:alpha-L-rhamnosidase
MNGHSVIYTIPSGVTVKALKYRETDYNTDFSGSFACNDNYFNTLWTKSQRTLYINMRDTYMDCPDRERAQWWGDAIIEIGQAFYALDRKSDLLSKKAISNLVKWQRTDSTLYSPLFDKELPLQMLASVGQFGFWNYFLHSGDTASIVLAYPSVKQYLNVWTFDADSLINHRKGGWDWIDWGTNYDTRVLDNTWYYLAIKAAREMAILTKHFSDTVVYNQRLNSIKNNFNRFFWQGQYYKSPAYTGQIDDRANAMAVVSGLAESDKWGYIRTVLANQVGASPYMEKYVLEAQYQMGFENDALFRMKRLDRYASMVNTTITTLFEIFGNSGTYNHAWSGGPLTLLSQYAAGISPESPGYGTFRVFPQEGYLTAINCIVPSVKGNISVSINKDSKNYSLKVNSPARTLAKIGIPKSINEGSTVKSIFVNGKKIFQNGSVLKSEKGVTYLGSDSKYYIFEVLPGHYEFLADTSAI